MSSHPRPTEPTPVPDASAQRVAHFQSVLHRLVDIGAHFAELIHEHVQTQVEAAPPEAARKPGPVIAEAAKAFERVSRSVRRSILLAQKLDEPVPSRAERHQAARRIIIRAVEDSIQRNAEDEDAEALQAEFLDRLDGPDLAYDIDGRPVAEIIAEICRDLGLDVIPGAHPWKRRTPEDIATLCAQAASPGAAKSLIQAINASARPSNAAQDPPPDRNPARWRSA